jgi:hypothetical protein
MANYKFVFSVLTVHDHTHILEKTVDYLESLSGSSFSLVLRQPVQPLQDRLDILLSEKFLYKFDCDALSNGITSATIHSLGRPRLSSLVTKASVVSNSVNILTTTSTIEGVRGIRVYISRRWTNCSIDSSKSTTESKLDIMPLAAWFLGCHKDIYILN